MSKFIRCAYYLLKFSVIEAMLGEMLCENKENVRRKRRRKKELQLGFPFRDFGTGNLILFNLLLILSLILEIPTTKQYIAVCRFAGSGSR